MISSSENGRSTRRSGGRATAARQADLRQHNVSLVLREILTAPAPLTRANIAERLQLTRATISDLVDRLVQAGFVEELSPVARPGAGRPGIPLRATSGRALAVGVVIQVDHVVAGLVDLRGEIVEQRTREVDLRGVDPARAVELVDELADPLLAGIGRKQRLLGAGLSVPGLVRRGSGQVRLAPNLGWESVDLLDLLVRQDVRWGDMDCVLGNDADVGAVAESWAAARQRPASVDGPSFVYVAGEVGIGGALVINGRLVSGQHGWSGEIGHICVDPQGPECGCGARGCLEQYAGRDALFRSAGLPATAEEVDLLRAVESGDPTARGAVEAAGRMLGVALANTLNVIDVDRVVVAGFLEAVHPYLRRSVERELFTRVLAARWSPLAVEVGDLGRDSALAGVGRLVLDRVIADPMPWLA